MLSGDSPEPVRSLAATRTGDVVLIKRILFGTLRSLCTDLGVREGDVVHCRAGSASHLLLDTPTGRTVPLDREWARFIQVSTLADIDRTAPLRVGADEAAI
jgi:hypothetical protein